MTASPIDHPGLTCVEAQLVIDHLRVERVELRQTLEAVELMVDAGGVSAAHLLTVVRRALR